jgi:hypothetical protein|tara:strand:+ start:1227 stop:1484 length:258 start_codon:yes stop_codon:yes gene_type:complete
MKQFELKKIQSVPNSYSGGTLFYLFFNDGEKSYKTCIDSRFRNYRNWKWLIENGKRGDIVTNLKIKSRGLINADSIPNYRKNIFV